jgi:hypothetical protein
MKFLTKRVFSIGTIILLHISFSLALIMAWTIVKRGWDFSVTSFSNEHFYMAGGPDEFNMAAVVTGALFRHLHFTHLTFYMVNVVMSSLTVFAFFHLARTCLTRKLALYITAIFAFNPEVAFYNNFVLKENMVLLVLVVAMYFFFKALTTDGPAFKILFCLVLPLLALLREPLALMGLLVIALLPKRAVPWAAVAALVLAYFVRIPCREFVQGYWFSHLGHYGITRLLLTDIYGAPTVITFGELFSTPWLFAEYFLRSLLFYIRPGWSAGVKFNTFLVPYTLFVVYVFVMSFPYRKYLPPAHLSAYLLIAVVVIVLSLIYIIYDPVERYRYSVYQLGFSLVVLNFYGYQRHRSCGASLVTAAVGTADAE